MPTYSEPNRLLGMEAPDFSLIGADGRQYSIADFKDASIIVIVFMCNHCPYVKATLDRVNRLAKEYRSQGVRFIGINSNDATKYPDDSFDQMKALIKNDALSFPYLWDESQEVARAYQAVCTPEFYVFKSDQEEKFKLKYHGRMDDSWKDEGAVTRRELALALDQLIAGNDPDSDQKSAMGCSIKWKTKA